MATSENSIEDVLDSEQRELAEKQERWARQRTVLGPLIEAIRTIPAGTKRFSFDNSLNITVSGGEAELTAAIRALRTRGFDLWNDLSDRPKKNSSYWSAFFYNNPESIEDADTIQIYFSFSSTVCRRVKVGTQTVVQDVYETVCGEIEA